MTFKLTAELWRGPKFSDQYSSSSTDWFDNFSIITISLVGSRRESSRCVHSIPLCIRVPRSLLRLRCDALSDGAGLYSHRPGGCRGSQSCHTHEHPSLSAVGMQHTLMNALTFIRSWKFTFHQSLSFQLIITITSLGSWVWARDITRYTHSSAAAPSKF